MVRVPLYEQQVSQRPIFQQTLTPNATPEAFGADIGRGMQQIGQGMGQAATALAQVQALEDTTRAKDADNQFAGWVRERMYGEGGFMTLSGRAAVDGRSAFESELEAKRREYGSKLTGGAAQSYTDASTARVNQTLQTSIVHTANERKQWFSDASAARLNTFSEDAVAAFNNPAKVNMNIAAGQAEIRQQGAMLGWDADTLRNREAEYISEVRLNTALRTLAADPVAAKKYYDEHKDQLTGPHQFKFEEALKVPLAAENVKRYTADFFTQAGAAPTAGDAAQTIRNFEGFKTTPYWDVNAYRTGYGSDTITKADGTVVKVTPGMSITRADAERDLSRRINTEFVPGIIKSVGQANWDKLPEPAKAALASVAYNYGSLPFSVASAVLTGDTAKIAIAVEGLKGHNDGINANRRMTEAAMIRGMAGTPAGVAPAQPGFGDVEAYLKTIANPEERELTRKAIYATMEAQTKAAKAQNEAYAAQAFTLIETQNISPFQLPAQITTAIGMEGMSSLMTYWEKRQSGQKVQTDPVILHDLQMAYARNPTEFAQRDLFQYKNTLSDADWKQVSGWKQTALTDERKAREDGLTLTSAFSQSETQLAAVGITTVGKEGDERQKAAQQIARFQAALASEMEAFKQQNQKTPTQVEIQSMVNRLLLPVVVKEPYGSFDPRGLFGGTSDRETFLFDAGKVGTMGNGVTSELNIKYTDIPVSDRVEIAAHLKTQLGRQPSEEQVVAVYEQFVLQKNAVPTR